MLLTRRQFLEAAAAVSLGFRGLHTLLARQIPVVRLRSEAQDADRYGPLQPDRAGVLDLPRGFQYSIISRMGQEMDDGLRVPGDPDGMAAFEGPDGLTLLVRNHELEIDEPKKSPFGRKYELLKKLDAQHLYDAGRNGRCCIGGTTTLVFDTKKQKLVRQFMSLAGTEYNCAGGPTPWGSWITCEETTVRAGKEHARDHGYNFEVPARAEIGLAAPTPLKAMGRFRHEAVAVEPKSGIVFQTEDVHDGLIYRFIPSVPGVLSAGGRLQALCVLDRAGLDTRNWLDDRGRPATPVIPPGERLAVKWIELEEIDSPEDDLRLRGHAHGAARFARAEGMLYGNSAVYFACTNGGPAQRGQIWKYTPSPVEGTAGEGEKPGFLELFVEPNDPDLIDNADNLAVSPWGDLIVCEDGSGEQYLDGITPDGRIYKLARNAANTSEFAGATFSPDGSTLFVNLQGAGLTVAITGPWNPRG